MKLIVQNIFKFILLVLVQVLVLNNIKFLGFINPYLYVLFIITLPISVPRGFLLLIAFLLGLSIDIFSNTVGVHAFATVFVAFMRDPLFSLFAPRDNHEYSAPSMFSFGANQFTKYAILMVFIHHTILFVLEAFSFENLGMLFLRILLNSIFTLVLLLGIERFKTR